MGYLNLRSSKILNISKSAIFQTAYSYNSENQLIQVASNEGPVASYRYDGSGRWIEENMSGVVTQYIYDGEDGCYGHTCNGQRHKDELGKSFSELKTFKICLFNG